MALLKYPATPLGAEDVWLRPWDSSVDLPALAAATRDAHIPATTTVPATFTEASACEWIARQERRREEGTGVVLAIAPRRGPAVGMIGVTGIDRYHRSGNLGYWVVPAVRGRRVASRAVAHFLDWVYEGAGLIRLEARVAVGNTSSSSLLTAAGFTLEGVAQAGLRLGMGWVDLEVYSRLRSWPFDRITWDAFGDAVPPGP